MSQHTGSATRTPDSERTTGASPSAPRPPAGGGRVRRPRLGGDFAYRYAVVGVLLLMVVVFSILLPDTFPTFDNLRATLATQAVLVILAIGLTFTLSTGEFDFTFGPVLAFSACFCGYLTSQHGWALVPAVLATLGCCVAIGLAQTLFIVRLEIPSLIASLALGMTLVGVTLGFTKANVVAPPARALTTLATGELFGLPYPVYFAFGIAAIAWYVYEHTPIGRYFYFVGEGRSAARLSGLPVDRVRALALVMTATIAGLAGLISFGRLGSADPNIGLTYLLPGTAAVFLGATAIKPGRFNAWGTVVAVYVLAVGVTGLQQLGADSWLENVFYGAALLAAVTFAALLRRGGSGAARMQAATRS